MISMLWNVQMMLMELSFHSTIPLSPMFLTVQFSSILLWYSAIIFGWWFSITTSGGEDSTWEQTVQTNISKLKTC